MQVHLLNTNEVASGLPLLLSKWAGHDVSGAFSTELQAEHMAGHAEPLVNQEHNWLEHHHQLGHIARDLNTLTLTHPTS